mgnify:CR=1 FL=1
MRAKMDFIMLVYAFFTYGVTLCSMSVKPRFVIAYIWMCFSINALRQNTSCWKIKVQMALVFLTGFGIMALVMRFFATSVQNYMLGCWTTTGCFLFLANKIIEVIEPIKEGDSKNEND